jgi:hypothetical protein
MPKGVYYQQVKAMAEYCEPSQQAYMEPGVAGQMVFLRSRQRKRYQLV